MQSAKLQEKEAVVVEAAVVLMVLKMPRESLPFQECLTYTLYPDRTP
jgi:hypothetical protein